MHSRVLHRVAADYGCLRAVQCNGNRPYSFRVSCLQWTVLGWAGAGQGRGTGRQAPHVVNFYSLNLPPAVTEGPSGAQQRLLWYLPWTAHTPDLRQVRVAMPAYTCVSKLVLQAKCSLCRLTPLSLLVTLS